MAEESDDISDGADRSADALSALADGPAREAADAISAAFREAGREIETSLAAAARSGELSFQSMAQAIGRDISSMAVDRFVREPLSQILDGAFGFLGARAGGGPVTPGGAYLVGETGPEIFRPAGAGSVEPAGARPVVVNVTLNGAGGAADPHRSEDQIAAAMARAASRAMGRL